MKPLIINDSFVTLGSFTLLGLGLFAIGESALWVISRFVYESGLDVMILINILRSPTILIIVTVELMVTLLIFRFIYLSRYA